MLRHIVFVAALMLACPSVSVAQVDPNWSQREMERMQAAQERFNAQVERQRAEQERFNAQVERQRAEQERFEAQAESLRADQNRATTSQSGSGCALCNLISIIDRFSKKRHSKAVGRMLAAGDCSGAQAYALSKGDFDLLAEIEGQCELEAIRDRSITSAAHWLKLEADADGTSYFVDPNSIHRVGENHAWRMHVVYAGESEIRTTSVLSLYRCSDRRNAVKSFVDYFRDGNIQAQTIEDRDLKFEALDLKTPVERALVEDVCSSR